MWSHWSNMWSLVTDFLKTFLITTYNNIVVIFYFCISSKSNILYRNTSCGLFSSVFTNLCTLKMILKHYLISSSAWNDDLKMTIIVLKTISYNSHHILESTISINY